MNNFQADKDSWALVVAYIRDQQQTDNCICRVYSVVTYMHQYASIRVGMQRNKHV